MNNDNSKLSKLISTLISPVAIGLLITLVYCATAFYYYLHKDRIKLAPGLFQIIYDIDQKSVDYRLDLRGVRHADPSVAILAVDDRSIDIVGRWPWPRDVIGRAISNAFEGGAKVIATDIVWSEPSNQTEGMFMESLKQKGLLTPDQFHKIKKEIKAADPDKKFATYIDKNKSGFVLGNFYKDEISADDKIQSGIITGHNNACYDLILNDTILKSLLDRQKIPFIAMDAHEVLLPDEFKLLYSEYLNSMTTEFENTAPAPKTEFEVYNQKKELLRQMSEYCDRVFLNLTGSDDDIDELLINIEKNWNILKTNIAGIESSTFEGWLNTFKNRNLLNAVPEALDWTLSIPLLLNASENFGYFNATLDDDGSIRRTQLLVRIGSNYLPSIALQAYLVASNRNVTLDIGENVGQGTKGIKSFTISNDEGDPLYSAPVTSNGQLLINYAGPRHTIPHASIADLLDENNPYILVTQNTKTTSGYYQSQTKKINKAKFLKDKIFVIGATAIGVFDMRVTPFDENYPGVETHANVIDNFIRQDFLSKNSKEDIWMPLLMLFIGITISIALSYFGAVSGLIFAAALIFLIAFIDRQFLFSNGQLVSIFLPIFQVFFTYVFLTFYKYFTEERSKKELRATFSKYVSPAIVEEILKDPKNLELGGKKERITVFFSDVRGFTTISEKLDPRALSDLLNSYLTPMTDLVFKNQGTLDKYMGDAVMAFFGAPVSYPDHAKMAALCALQSLDKLKELCVEYEKKKLPMIDIGIGLNTGECSVGNMGSETVRSYTVMGDAVNLASRLEGINKTYGTHIIISEFTYADIKDDFLCREVDWVKVKGKLKPVKIFELISETSSTSKLYEMSKYFNDGYALYHEKQFKNAIQMFENALLKNPQDETSKIYINRCQELILTPPPLDWDGVFVMKTK